jgi:hypothetical protein
MKYYEYTPNSGFVTIDKDSYKGVRSFCNAVELFLDKLNNEMKNKADSSIVVYFENTNLIINNSKYHCFILRLISLLEVELKKNNSFIPIFLLVGFNKNQKNTDKIEKLSNSVFFNSTFWIHLIEVDEKSGKLENNVIENHLSNFISHYSRVGKLESNIDEYYRLHILNLLKINNLEFNLTQGHDTYITPFLYSNETEKLQSILKLNELDKECTIPIIYDKPQIAKYPDAGYNILLLDDKKEKGKLIQALLRDWSKNDYVEKYSKDVKKNEIIKEFFSEYEKEVFKSEINLEESRHKHDDFKTWIEQEESNFSKNEKETGECSKTCVIFINHCFLLRKA